MIKINNLFKCYGKKEVLNIDDKNIFDLPLNDYVSTYSLCKADADIREKDGDDVKFVSGHTITIYNNIYAIELE